MTAWRETFGLTRKESANIYSCYEQCACWGITVRHFQTHWEDNDCTIARCSSWRIAVALVSGFTVISRALLDKVSCEGQKYFQGLETYATRPLYWALHIVTYLVFTAFRRCCLIFHFSWLVTILARDCSLLFWRFRKRTAKSDCWIRHVCPSVRMQEQGLTSFKFQKVLTKFQLVQTVQKSIKMTKSMWYVYISSKHN